MDADQVDKVADELFGAFMAHDYDAIRALCAPEARAWSNVNGTEQDIEGLIAFMPLMKGAIGAHSYGNVRRLVVDGGFVEQHGVTTVQPDGTELDLGDVCVVVRLDADGKVTRVDEYLDTLHVHRTLTPG
jgi:ketosteroid isomerase-like protein